MIKATLFGATPELNAEETGFVIKIHFSQVDRWSPRVLLGETIDIHVWLRFLDDCMKRFTDPDHPMTLGFMSTDHTDKSQVKLIGGGTHYCPIPKPKWKRFVEQEVEKLFLQGVIVF